MQDKTKASASTLVTIQVFKTNLLALDVSKIETFLNAHPYVIKWNIDLEDVDKVLRIVTIDPIAPSEIRSVLTSLGYFCEELT